MSNNERINYVRKMWKKVLRNKGLHYSQIDLYLEMTVTMYDQEMLGICGVSKGRPYVQINLNLLLKCQAILFTELADRAITENLNNIKAYMKEENITGETLNEIA